MDFLPQKSALMLVNKEENKSAIVNSLTEREKEIIQLIVQELTSQEIADKLFISKKTVDTHRKNLLQKIDVKNIVGLIKFAYEHGIN